MATASKPAASKTASKPKASTKAEAPAANEPAKRTGVNETVVEDSTTAEVPTNAAGEIALPDDRENDKAQAKEAAKEGDPIDDIQKEQEDSVRTEIDTHAAAVEANPEHPEEELETVYLVGGEVPANAPGTEGLEREPRK